MGRTGGGGASADAMTDAGKAIRDGSAPGRAAWTQEQMLTASDEDFGWDISISGDTAVIGADGSVYVFVRSGEVWTEQQKLTAGSEADREYLGSSVSISGDTAVIGTLADPAGGSGPGSAYVFVRRGTTWIEEQKLTASDVAQGDWFGRSVSISGDTAIVGTTYETYAGGSGPGSAYVFFRSGGVWTQEQKLTASDGAADDWFGSPVSISGDTAIIGAWGDDDNGDRSGSAYVFVRSGTTWTEAHKLTARNGKASDWFGRSVSISGDTAIIAAAGADSGSAHVFVRSGTTWTHEQTLTASDGVGGEVFGDSVCILGDTAIVGAYYADAGRGAAYVFTRGGTTWTQEQKLSPSDETVGFGTAVAILGDTAIIGTAYDDTDGGSGPGSAYVFKSR